MKKSSLFCIAACMIFVSGILCPLFLDECDENSRALASAKRVSQKTQKNVIIKLKKLERDIFGGHEDGIRED